MSQFYIGFIFDFVQYFLNISLFSEIKKGCCSLYFAPSPKYFFNRVINQIDKIC